MNSLPGSLENYMPTNIDSLYYITTITAKSEASKCLLALFYSISAQLIFKDKISPHFFIEVNHSFGAEIFSSPIIPPYSSYKNLHFDGVRNISLCDRFIIYFVNKIDCDRKFLLVKNLTACSHILLMIQCISI